MSHRPRRSAGTFAQCLYCMTTGILVVKGGYMSDHDVSDGNKMCPASGLEAFIDITQESTA